MPESISSALVSSLEAPGFPSRETQQFPPGRSCLSGKSVVSHRPLQPKDNKQWGDLRKATHFVPLIPRLGFQMRLLGDGAHADCEDLLHPNPGRDLHTGAVSEN